MTKDYNEEAIKNLEDAYKNVLLASEGWKARYKLKHLMIAMEIQKLIDRLTD